MNDDFENRLQQQPFRRVPDEWRAKILQRASDPRPSTLDPRHSFVSTLNHHLSTLLWPNPKAWAGLGCVWILIFALHAGSRGNAPMLAHVPAPKAASMMMTLKDRQQTLAELLGNNPPSDADQPRRFNPQPHSERHMATAMA